MEKLRDKIKNWNNRKIIRKKCFIAFLLKIEENEMNKNEEKNKKWKKLDSNYKIKKLKKMLCFFYNCL